MAPQEYQEDLLQRFARAHLSDLLSEDPNSKLQLVIDKVFDAKQIVDATQYMEAASNIGKIVCEITSDL